MNSVTQVRAAPHQLVRRVWTWPTLLLRKQCTSAYMLQPYPSLKWASDPKRPSKRIRRFRWWSALISRGWSARIMLIVVIDYHPDHADVGHCWSCLLLSALFMLVLITMIRRGCCWWWFLTPDHAGGCYGSHCWSCKRVVIADHASGGQCWSCKEWWMLIMCIVVTADHGYSGYCWSWV